MSKNVLVIAESDPFGFAGIQGDIKTSLSLGVPALSVITSIASKEKIPGSDLRITPMTKEVVEEQLIAALNVGNIGCIKMGIVPKADMIKSIAEILEDRAPHIPLILAPVSTIGGKTFMSNEASQEFRRSLLIMSNIIVVNIPEAEIMTGLKIFDMDTMIQASQMLMTLGNDGVLLTGGVGGEEGVLYDVLTLDNGHQEVFTNMVDPNAKMYGRGYALTTAIACNVTKGFGIRDSVIRSRDFLNEAIKASTPVNGSSFSALNYMKAGSNY